MTRFAEMAVLFVGAANMDILAHTKSSALAGASNPSIIKQVPGGAALNAASICARFGVTTCLSTVLGNDSAGDTLLTALKNRHVQVFPTPAPRSGSYIAIVNPNGGLVMAASDMESCETRRIQTPKGVWNWRYIDANLESEQITEIASQSSEPVALASVSVAKVERLRNALPHASLLFTNAAEWQELCGADLTTFRNMSDACVVITDGGNPITLIEEASYHSIPVPRVNPIVDVIGAGDAIAGGTLAGLAKGMTLHMAIEQGIAAASEVLRSEGPYPDRSSHLD